MDMKDVAEIAKDKAFTKTFTKKWWESKRAVAAHGSGAGKAFDEWQKKCRKSVDQMSAKEVQDAEDTCALLTKCLKAAIAKCGDKQKETTAGCKAYLKHVTEFEAQLAERSKEVSNKLANVIVDLEDFHAKTLVPAGKLLSTLSGGVGELRKRTLELQAEADKVTLDKDKVVLQKQIGDVVKTLDRVSNELGDLSIHLKNSLNGIDPVVQQARKDARFRKALVDHEKHAKAVVMGTSNMYDMAEGLKAELQVVFSDLSANETADKALKTMEEKVAWFPSDFVAGEMDDRINELKTIAATLGKYKHPETLSEQEWSQIDAWEDRCRDDAQMQAAAFQKGTREMIQIQGLAKRWKDEPKAQELLKEGTEAFNTFKRQTDVYDKLNAAIRNRIGEMNKLRK